MQHKNVHGMINLKIKCKLCVSIMSIDVSKVVYIGNRERAFVKNKSTRQFLTLQ